MASLSFTNKTGYYGLRVNPTFDEVLGTVGKPLGLKAPSRFATWYANSPYRAYELESSQHLTNHERALLEYRASGGELPEQAAADVPSAAGEDDLFARIEKQHEAMDEHAAFQSAKSMLQRERQQETQRSRAEQLYAMHGPNAMDPTIEAAHDELEEAGVHHYMPSVMTVPPAKSWKEPPPQITMAGHSQAPEFPSFEALNMGQGRVQQATLTRDQNLTFERVRDFVVGPTFST